MTDDRSLMWSGPGRALDAHLDLYKLVEGAWKFIRDRAGKPTNVSTFPSTLQQRLRLMTSFDENKMELQLDGQSISARQPDIQNWSSVYNVERTAGLLGIEYKALNEGETHYVSHHVMSTLEAAAESMDDEPIFPTDLPSPSGVIVFEFPLLLPDLHPETGVVVPELLMPIRAVGWFQHLVHVRDAETGELSPRDGFHYTIYTDSDSFNKIFVESAKRLFGGDNEHVMSFSGDSPIRFWAADATAWAFGMKWKTGTDVNAPFGLGEVPANIAILRRWLLAYFRWTWQRILVPERYVPRKHERRRAERAGRKFEGDDHIKVLRLRREVEAEKHQREHGGDGFVYSHQWLARGHWRRVHYRSLGPARNEDGSFNNDSHRLKWIEPYLSGNPYGPLVLGHNVNAAVR